MGALNDESGDDAVLVPLLSETLLDMRRSLREDHAVRLDSVSHCSFGVMTAFVPRNKTLTSYVRDLHLVTCLTTVD